MLVRSRRRWDGIYTGEGHLLGAMVIFERDLPPPFTCVIYPSDVEHVGPLRVGVLVLWAVCSGVLGRIRSVRVMVSCVHENVLCVCIYR